MKFVVGDLRVMPLIKKSHVVYCKFPSLFEIIVKGCWGGMGPIDLPKDRERGAWSSVLVMIRGNIFRWF